MKPTFAVTLAVLALAAALHGQTAGSGAFAPRASTDILRLENDIAARESVFRATFVGRLKRGGSTMREQDAFEPLQRAQALVDELRRALRDVTGARARREIDANTAIGRHADLATRALLGRWQLQLDETEMAVELARQTYEAVIVETNRQRAIPAQRAGAIARERDARSAATRSLDSAEEGLRRSRDDITRLLGTLVAQLRQAGRRQTADAIAAQLDERLNATPVRQPTVPTMLDRFLAAQTIDFESANDNERPDPATMAGRLAAIDVTRAGTPLSAKTIAFVRSGPMGDESTSDLAFGRAYWVEVEFDDGSGPETEQVTLEWTDGTTTTSQVIPVQRTAGTTFRSGVMQIWPAGGAVFARLPATTRAPGGRSGALGSIRLTDAGAAAPGAAPLGPSSATSFDAEIATLQSDIARFTRDLASGNLRLGGPRETRMRARELREALDQLRRSLTPPDPPAGSRADRDLRAFRTKWEPVADAIWSGQPSPAPVAMDPAVLLPSMQPPCDVSALPRPAVAPIGRTWACLSDAFFYELNAMEAQIDRVSTQIRDGAVTPAETALQHVEVALKPESAPAATAAARAAWLVDMARRLRQADLELARLRLIDLERRRALAANASSPYGWIVAWRRGVLTVPQSEWAPLVVRLKPGTDLRASFGTKAITGRVELAPPSDLAKFFARSLYTAHDQQRRLGEVGTSAVDEDVRRYESTLDARYGAAGDTDFENSDIARTRREAVQQRRDTLVSALVKRLAEARERLDRARTEALKAIEESR